MIGPPAETLARELAEADAATRAALWAKVEDAAPLAWALKGCVDAAWTTAPQAVPRLAEILDELARRSDDPDARALAEWSRGIAHLVRGEMAAALGMIAQAAARLDTHGRRTEAAQVRVSQVMALAMLGRYDEAIACGERARDVFVEVGDAVSAGKIDLNLGNLALHRDRYGDAACHYRAAADRFAAAGDDRHALMARKNLAESLALQHEFEAAASMFGQALAQAQQQGHAQMEAQLEGAIGELEMLRGAYDRALRHLERSRSHFEALAMPYELAVAQQSLADAYLELRLLPEALALYDRALATYAAAGNPLDRAWALAQRGRLLALLRDGQAARESLRQAQQLFAANGNAVGAAIADLRLAELALLEGDSVTAQQHARAADAPLLAARHMTGHLGARALMAEALARAGQSQAAVEMAAATHAESVALGLPQIARQCSLTLGLLARDRGDRREAENHFAAAVAGIESQRGTLPGEMFRSAFFGGNLTPYQELARLALQDGDPAGAFLWLERARARALSEAMDDGSGRETAGDDESRRIADLRQRLNACYRQLARPETAAGSVNRLQEEARSLETDLLEAERRAAQLRAPAAPPGASRQTAIDLPALLDALGGHTVLVEYFALDGLMHACVVGQEGVRALPLDVTEAQAAAAIGQLRFQTDTFRHGAARLRHRMPELRARALHHLQQLHRWLWAPLAPLVGARRVVVVPHAELHALPFEALYDGSAFEIERREIARCPSAQVLLRCLARPPLRVDRALLLGHADARLPDVVREVGSVAARFKCALTYAGDAAGAAVLRATPVEAGVVHIASHAQFRGDNPRFSALHLADGALTADEVARLRFPCGLLTLSACETAVAHVMPGNEPIGLTAAFLAAGAATVVASLWTVQDETTAEFMARFYELLAVDRQPARSLRAAQCELLARQPHPYFWSAFTVYGRW